MMVRLYIYKYLNCTKIIITEFDGGRPNDILGIEGLVYNADISATLLLWSDLLLDIWPNEISPSLKNKTKM